MQNYFFVGYHQGIFLIEDRRQKSEDRRQKAEGRRQKTEDRRQNGVVEGWNDYKYYFKSYREL